MAKQQQQEEEAAPKKKSKLKIVLLIIMLLLLGLGGAGSFWWFQLSDSVAEESSTRTANGETVNATGTTGTVDPNNPDANNQNANDPNANNQNANEATKPKSVVNIVNIPTVTVNLADTNPIRYLKIGMDVEVNASSAVTALNSQLAKVRDAMIIILSSKTYNDLASTAGKLLIKNEIATRLNQVLGAPRVVQIYFTEFVVQ